MTPRLAWLTAVALLGAESAGVLSVVQQRVWLGLAIHGVCTTVAIAAAWRPTVPDAAVATLRLMALMIGFLGPVAPAAAAVIFTGQIVNRRQRAGPIATAALWHEHLFPNLATDWLAEAMDSIHRHQTGAEDEAVQSFYDVLKWGELAEQEHVLSLVSRSYRAEFAPVLRAGLAVSDLGLRAQAAAGLSVLETRISARIAAAEQAHRDAVTRGERRDRAIELAEILSGAAHSELYDAVRTQEMRRQVVALLKPMLAVGAIDPALGAVLGRTLLHLGELDDAVATLEQVVTHGRQTDAAFAWLVEGLFRRGDHRGLRALVTRHPDQVGAMIRADGPLAPALQFWRVLA